MIYEVIPELEGVLNFPIEYKYPPLQAKEVEATSVLQLVDPDEGYYGLSKVIVAPVTVPPAFTITDGRYLFYKGARIDEMNDIFKGLKANLANGMFYLSPDTAPLNLSNLDTSNITSMAEMFYSCKASSIDLSTFDTSKVTAMNNMFQYCSNLTSLDLSTFDTSKVTAGQSMFSGCSKLVSLNLSGLNTSKFGGFGGMFSSCSALTTLDISSFTCTSSSINTVEMFSGCINLKHLDARNFPFTRAWNYSTMFNRVPVDCEIIVKDDTEKAWINSHFSTLTNVKTVAEYEAEQ